MAQEDILIRIRAIDEASKTIQRVSGSLKQLSAPMEKMTVGMGNVQRTIVKTYKPAVAGFQSMGEATDAAGLSTKKWESYARKNFLVQAEGGGIMDRLTGRTISYGQAVKDATMQGRRFKFEWLSIMFAGMALDRAFGGLVKTQLELFGVSGLMADAWTVVLLPTMEKIVPLLFSMLKAFMEMPEWLQTAVGGFVLFGAAMGKILTVIGQFILAFMGFKILGTSMPILAKFGGAVKGLTSAIAGLGATAGIVIGAVIAVIVGMYLAWKENFLNMQQVVQNWINGIKQAFSGLIGIFTGIFKIAQAILTEDLDLFIEGVKKIFMSLWDFLVGGFKVAFNFIRGVLTGALKILYNIINLLIKIGGRVGNLISGRGFTEAAGVGLPSLATSPRAGGGAQSVSVSPTYNITVSDKPEMERVMRENNLSLVEEIKRRIAP